MPRPRKREMKVEEVPADLLPLFLSAAGAYGLTLEQFIGRSSTPRTVKARGEAAAELHSRGWTYTAIAKVLGYSGHHSVILVLRRVGMHKPQRAPAIKLPMLRMVLDRRIQAIPWSQIAYELRTPEYQLMNRFYVALRAFKEGAYYDDPVTTKLFRVLFERSGRTLGGAQGARLRDGGETGNRDVDDRERRKDAAGWDPV